MSAEDVHTVAIELTTMSKLVDKLIDEIRDIRREIGNVKTRIDDKVQVEFATLERRYINMLEGKLVQFDQESARLKAEKEAEYQRLHGYFYSGGRP